MRAADGIVTQRARTVTRTYLEMRSPDELRPARVPDPAPTLDLVSPPDGSLSRELYLAVGQAWWWTERQDWPVEAWERWAAGAATWVGHLAGERIGYGELYLREPGELELAYFGLLPGWSGRGLGGHLLTELVRRAWKAPGTSRVWLSTGSLDSEAALPGYLKRGFVPFKTLEEPRPAPPRFLP
ncbi:MAG TPA: GNAT family N-acetyltransferase [Solirubrobacterales bacterium]